MRLWPIVAALGSLMLFGGSMSGQALPERVQRPAFRGSVDVVPLTVTVTDGSRRYVSDLEEHDFQIFEDGRPQKITFFQRTSVPLVVALLIDTSASMDRTLPVAQKAAAAFVRGLSAVDAAMIVDFDSRVKVLQTLTTDTASLEEAIAQTRVGGSTALYNSVYIALKELNKKPAEHQPAELKRRALVVLSDGEDTSSIVTLDEVLDLATRSDTAIYTIGLLEGASTERRKPQEAKFALRHMADRTGGRAFFPSDADAFAGIYHEIRTELSSQYSLAYESDNLRRDGQFRRIVVRVSSGMSARTRAGYYASTK